jgi:phosphoribosylaminoimidazole-succinocarboxamide synthase
MNYDDSMRREAAPAPFLDSALPLAGKTSGKVRDSYPLEGRRRLLVTTDRLSAFDRVLAALPYKGQILNELSAWWFRATADIIPNHLVSVPDPNAAVVLEASPLPIEVIVRGYITGVTSTALWHRYSLGERSIYGYDFPEGLGKNSPLPEAIVTPTTKGGPTGHDERLSRAEVVEKGYLDAPTWEAVEKAALALFARGQEKAAAAGLILVDTKYEFGLDASGRLILIDELHTPDSSRFWEASSYEERIAAGLEPESFDKEALRLAYAGLGYRGEGPAPALPSELLGELRSRYLAVFERLTGLDFVPGAYPVEGRLVANLRKERIIE